MYTSFKELVSSLMEREDKMRLAVSASDDFHTVEAAIYAYNEGVVIPVFVGDKEITSDILGKMGYDPDKFTIIDEKDGSLSCKRAVSLVCEGKADFLMKGKIDTSVLLKEVVNKETGLGLGKIMSHVAMFEVPSFPRLVTVVDGGMLTYPDLEGKKAIIENTVECLLNMGYKEPKVGVITCVEKLNPKMPETVDGDLLKKMNQNGEIKNCIVDGPISFDCAVNKEICKLKGFESPVAGEADVFLMPNIHTANICGKTLLCMAGAKMAGFVAGAKCPVILSSRGASAEEKFYSIVLGAAAAKRN